MPKETDPERLAALRRVLRDTASNVVCFNKRAFVGSDEPNDLGLHRILPAEMTPWEKSRKLKCALIEFLERGGSPNRVDYVYEDGDPEVIYEFRFRFADVPVYVKTEWVTDDPDDPVLIIRSVKRQDQRGAAR